MSERFQPGRAWLDGVVDVALRVARAASRIHAFVAAEARGLHSVIDEVLSAAAHELRTPLAVVRAEAQILLRERGADARLANITRQVDRLTHVVEQLLEAARLPFGSAPTAVETIDLQQLLATVVERYERPARKHRIRLSGTTNQVRVRADPQRIALALASLIDNAVRFSPGGGVVDVSLHVTGGEAVVSIHDQGVGIPLQRQRRIFELLYRAHAGTQHDRSGIGIGLAVTRNIVAEHGGAIWFTSASHRGSTFAFSLPLVASGQ